MQASPDEETRRLFLDEKKIFTLPTVALSWLSGGPWRGDDLGAARWGARWEGHRGAAMALPRG